MRLVAPVWSFGPHGEAGTILLQSVWASAAGADASRAASITSTTIRGLRLMRRTPFDGEGHMRGRNAGMLVPIPGTFKALCGGNLARC